MRVKKAHKYSRDEGLISDLKQAWNNLGEKQHLSGFDDLERLVKRIMGKDNKFTALYGDVGKLNSFVSCLKSVSNKDKFPFTQFFEFNKDEYDKVVKFFLKKYYFADVGKITRKEAESNYFIFNVEDNGNIRTISLDYNSNETYYNHKGLLILEYLTDYKK